MQRIAFMTALEAVMRRRSGSSLNLVPKAAVTETQKIHRFLHPA
jgi:1,2-phenylacetyl-CoA epoxidase PaaB subunit